MFKITDYIPEDKLRKICQKHHIIKISLFGSALHGDLKPESDIDLLVKFKKGTTPGFITLCGIENELTALIGRKVDLRTIDDLSRYFKDEVINNSEVQYEV